MGTNITRHITKTVAARVRALGFRAEDWSKRHKGVIWVYSKNYMAHYGKIIVRSCGTIDTSALLLPFPHLTQTISQPVSIPSFPGKT